MLAGVLLDRLHVLAGVLPDCLYTLAGVYLDCLQVFYYSAGVFEKSGIPVDMIQYAVLGTGIINVLMTGISVRRHHQHPHDRRLST